MIFSLSAQWEQLKAEEPPDVVFPPDDLARALFRIFFENVNPFYPLLHRPTFERNYHECLHHESRSFAATVLVVCANGARWSDDPRCLGDGGTGLRHTAGWEWFERAQSLSRNTLKIPTLHDVQFYAVSI
jgi:hypothetical protein